MKRNCSLIDIELVVKITRWETAVNFCRSFGFTGDTKLSKQISQHFSMQKTGLHQSPSSRCGQVCRTSRSRALGCYVRCRAAFPPLLHLAVAGGGICRTPYARSLPQSTRYGGVRSVWACCRLDPGLADCLRQPPCVTPPTSHRAHTPLKKPGSEKPNHASSFLSASHQLIPAPPSPSARAHPPLPLLLPPPLPTIPPDSPRLASPPSPLMPRRLPWRHARVPPHPPEPRR